jgi:hypothetical protein
MTAANLQITQLAKQGLTAAEIAEALGYDVETVGFVLTADSEVVKELENARVEKAEDNRLGKAFNALEETAFKVMKALLTNAEKETVQADMAKYVIDHQLGLKRPPQLRISVDVSTFNERLLLAKKRKQELEQGSILIESSPVNS